MTGHRVQQEDEFVDVWFGDEQRASPRPTLSGKPAEEEAFTEQWMHQSSARHAYVPTTAGYALRKLYPKHSIVLTQDPGLSPLSFPGAYAIPLEKTPLMTEVFFATLPKRSGGGVLVDSIDYAAFRVAWDKYEFLTFHITYPAGFFQSTCTFILHEGPSEDPARAMLRAIGLWRNELHEEIWVYNQGWWDKDHDLWLDVQKGRWEDVILHEKFKTALQKDVYGFFDSENVYKRLGIPWKRGLIMYGPPGNGKTISLKVIIKTCSAKGFSPLYVKSFQSWQGEEAGMQQVFDKARELSPCVLVMEDMDSLINDQNRSFFLNQMDGLIGNDGLLVIGTTNHFDRLDPGLSGRPSRFDRKYLFDDPDREGRVLYARYWQNKLKGSEGVVYPDSFVYTVADSTDGFSFAYLKEAFVSALVVLAGTKGDLSFEDAVKEQIKELHKALDRQPKDTMPLPPLQSSNPVLERPPQQPLNREKSDIQALRRRLASLDTQHTERRFYVAHRQPGPNAPQDGSRPVAEWSRIAAASQAQRLASGSTSTPSTPSPPRNTQDTRTHTPATAPRVLPIEPKINIERTDRQELIEQAPASTVTKTSFSWYHPQLHGPPAKK